MKLKALVLAGGLGTRLQSVVNDVPKSLAPIGGRPFLWYLLNRIEQQGLIDEVILSVGYKADLIIDMIGHQHGKLKITYCREEKPLGTGGAIRFALSRNPDFEDVLVMNGDTFSAFDIGEFYRFHKSKAAGITLVSLRMKDFDRYGSISVNQTGEVLSFNEKKFTTDGLISCGAYFVSKTFFNDVFRKQTKETFSIEKDILEVKDRTYPIFAYVADFYFIDIGIPEDYARAQVDFTQFR